MTIAIRHAWLQKHPSPSADGGEFHWHPADRDRDLRAGCVERMRGIEPPAVLWQLGPGRIAWAQLFAAIAPLDHRNYAGVVLTIAEADGATAAELLEGLAIPEPSAWTPDAEAKVRQAGSRGRAASSVDAGVARALLSGGQAAVEDPSRPELPAQIAVLERCMPRAVAGSVRRGVWRTRRTALAPDAVAELAVAACRDPASRAGCAWRLLGELAELNASTVDELAARTGKLDDVLQGALTDAEKSALGGPRTFVETLHAWGRGRLDRCASAATVPARFADVLALRMLARLVTGRDARDAVAEARWYALLPSARRNALLAEVAGRTATLRSLVEQHHA